MRKKELIFLVLLIIIHLTYAFYDIGNEQLNINEFEFAQVTEFSPWIGLAPMLQFKYNHLPLFYFILKIVFTIFGFGLMQMFIFSMLLSSLIIIVFYFILREFVNSKYAFLYTIFFISTFVNRHHSRETSEYVFVSLLFLLFLYVTLRHMKYFFTYKKRNLTFFWQCVAVLFLFSMTHNFSLLVFVLFLLQELFISLVYFSHKKNWKENIFPQLKFIFIPILIYIPFLLINIYNFFVYKNIFGEITITSPLPVFNYFFVKEYNSFNIISNNFSLFFIFCAILLCFFISFILVIVDIKKKTKKFSFETRYLIGFLLIQFFAYIFFFSYIASPDINYISPSIYPFMYVIIFILIIIIIGFFTQLYHSLLKIIFISLICVFIVFNLVTHVNLEFEFHVGPQDLYDSVRMKDDCFTCYHIIINNNLEVLQFTRFLDIQYGINRSNLTNILFVQTNNNIITEDVLDVNETKMLLVSMSKDYGWGYYDFWGLHYYDSEHIRYW